MNEEQARRWPDLMKVLEEKVKPERLKKSAEVAKSPWWQFWRARPELHAATSALPRVLAVARVGQQCAFTFLQSGTVFSDQLIVFAYATDSALCVMQSRVHEVWARFFASSMKDDLRYTPSDCFETFPLPDDFEPNAALEAAGKAYYEFRADLMVRNNEGLTKTYNRFHDREHDATETNQEIVAGIRKLRELHAAMDRSVLDAYGGDLAKLTVPPCEFLPDYEDEEDEDEPAGGRQRKKPWRYRWPDAFRDEVLALLLDLNKKRAEEVKLTALPPAKPKKAAPRKTAKPDSGGALF